MLNKKESSEYKEKRNNKESKILESSSSSSSSSKEKKSQYDFGNIDINAIRQSVVSQDFSNNINQRVIVLLGQYPFLIIGLIKEVVGDIVFIKAEFTHVSELDGFEFRIHLDDIEVYFIETEFHKIPKMHVSGEEH